ncbi:hypothetical protein ACQP1W_08945 [Spirillospora sp. CA-255316]
MVREQALRLAHPHVMTPYAWYPADEDVLLAMNLVRGGSLETLLGDYGRLPAAYAAELLDQVLAAFLDGLSEQTWGTWTTPDAGVLTASTGSPVASTPGLPAGTPVPARPVPSRPAPLPSGLSAGSPPPGRDEQPGSDRRRAVPDVHPRRSSFAIATPAGPSRHICKQRSPWHHGVEWAGELCD